LQREGKNLELREEETANKTAAKGREGKGTWKGVG